MTPILRYHRGSEITIANGRCFISKPYGFTQGAEGRWEFYHVKDAKRHIDDMLDWCVKAEVVETEDL